MNSHFTLRRDWIVTTGWGDESWTAFCGPAAVGGAVSDTIHMGAAVGGRQLLCYITGRQLIGGSFAKEQTFHEDLPGPLRRLEPCP
jgi:hypothetical protein